MFFYFVYAHLGLHFHYIYKRSTGVLLPEFYNNEMIYPSRLKPGKKGDLPASKTLAENQTVAQMGIKGRLLILKIENEEKLCGTKFFDLFHDLLSRFNHS
jgi:hypothetical protein